MLIMNSSKLCYSFIYLSPLLLQEIVPTLDKGNMLLFYFVSLVDNILGFQNSISKKWTKFYIEILLVKRSILTTNGNEII